MLIIVLGGETVYGFHYHLSYMGNYDLTKSQLKGDDLTMIFGKNVGLRYSRINAFDFVETGSNLGGSQSIHSYAIKGDYKMPMLLKMVDYKSFQGNKKGPFDFLTAYYGLGFANLDLQIHKTAYSASGGDLIRTWETENVNAPVYAASVGFYGGEKFMVIDTRLRYIKGEIKNSQLLEDQVKFDDWSIIFSLGVGF